MRTVILSLCISIVTLFLAAVPVVAQITNIPAQHSNDAVALYPEDNVGAASDEIWTNLGPMTVIRNVTRPTLTPILPPREKASGAAVILAPGGGMLFLSMPNGQIAQTLTDKGIAVFILRYRVVPTPPDIAGLREVFAEMSERSKEGEVILDNPDGDADAQAAVALVRAKADEWNVDPAKVGLLGFSSGAQVSRMAALSENPEGRPDFVGLIFGAMDPVEVPETAPPMFAAIAIDDMTVPNVGFPVVAAWRKAKRPVELHAYERGGHGFAQGGTNATHRLYLDQFMAWMTMHGFLNDQETEPRR